MICLWVVYYKVFPVRLYDFDGDFCVLLLDPFAGFVL